LRALAIVLAVLDLAPIFFMSLGMFFLAQLVDRLDPRCRRLALSGLALVIMGGVAGAASNLWLAAFDEEIPLLAAIMHVFGAPGSVLMAAALIRGRATSQAKAGLRDPWIAPAVISWLALIAAFFTNSSANPEAWTRPLVALSVSAGIALCVAAFSLSWKRQLHMAAGLFAFNASVAVLVSGIRILVTQSIWIHMFVLLISLAAQMSFAFASWRVAAEYEARVGPSPTKP
jgi:hypothetical protein